MEEKITAGTLHLRTLEMLKESKLTLPELYKATDIPFYWLRKFRNKEIANPSVNRVQKLYEFLASRELKV